MLVDIKREDATATAAIGAVSVSVKSTGQIGADFWAFRRARGRTLSQLAERLDRSVGWLSKVEPGVSKPALDNVRTVAFIFALPISFFFSQSPSSPKSKYIMSSDYRWAMSDDSAELVESPLSPDLSGAFEILHSVPGLGVKCPQPFVRSAKEVGDGIDGSLNLIIDGREFALNIVQSFRFAGETASWMNQGTKPAVLSWVISPIVY